MEDSDGSERFLTAPGSVSAPIVLPEHELLPQLARLGVAMQRREYDHAMGAHGNPTVFDDDLRLPRTSSSSMTPTTCIHAPGPPTSTSSRTPDRPANEPYPRVGPGCYIPPHG
ncbi:hypothetical protein [Cystobacter fuscus]|uniref:hypothetical protein n=1 Tax=Cystobacter fuscus TaxID=43 RepID=UPI0012FD737C|nr:hypothetical protein [Cystobacter fuscus]